MRGRAQSSSRRGRCRSRLPPVAPLLLVGAVPQVWVRTLGEHGEELGVAQPQRVGLARRLELLDRELADRLQHPVPRAPRGLAAADEALVDQRLQRVDLRAADSLGRLVRATAGEHREPREQLLFLRREEVVRPTDRRVERLLARIRVAAAFQSSSPPPRRSSSCSGEKSGMRAAASSSASGRLSSRLHSSADAAVSPRTPVGARGRAR